MRWVVENWHLLLAKPWDAVVLVLLAAASGAWVGTERQRREKAAGLRTMALVALGSCVFTMVGFAFTSTTGDSGRVAAQIVAGIGFLGAGALLRGTYGIEGMTTAATIWVVAAIGMSIGAGYVPGGLGLALLTRGVLTIAGRWEHRLFAGKHAATVLVVFDPDHGKTAVKLDRLLAEFYIAGEGIRREKAGDGREQWAIRFQLAERHHHDFLAALADVPGVIAITRTTADL
ncbi:MAG TPA: MgtC/SapB family protein [Chthoniobacterales bacterium]